MAWNVVDRYKMDPSGAADNAAALALLSSDLADYYAANKPLPRVIFPEGMFAFSKWPNMAYPGLQIVGEGMAILKHTGTGDAITFDGSITNNAGWNGANDLTIGPFIVVPNQGSGNGLVIKQIHRSKVDARVMAAGIPPAGGMYAAIDVIFCVCLEMDVNVPGYYAIPSIQPTLAQRNNCIGLRMGAIPGSTFNSPSTGCIAINPTMEMVNIGILLDSANGNHFIGGVCEACQTGVQLQSNSEFNNFDRIDLEDNANWDLVCDKTTRGNTFSVAGPYNSWKTNVNGWDNVVTGRLRDLLPI